MQSRPCIGAGGFKLKGDRVSVQRDGANLAFGFSAHIT
jgi:hypothetical protein